MIKAKNRKQYLKQKRVRQDFALLKLKGKNSSLPLLQVNRSLKHLQGVIFDACRKKVLLTLSSESKIMKKVLVGKTKTEQAFLLGQTLATQAQEQGIKKVIFLRHGYKFTGRVASFAQGFRESGLLN